MFLEKTKLTREDKHAQVSLTTNELVHSLKNHRYDNLYSKDDHDKKHINIDKSSGEILTM